MDASRFYSEIVVPAGHTLEELDTLAARKMLLAIAGTESAWFQRLQRPGPARSYWQVEMEAVVDLLSRPGTNLRLAYCCHLHDVACDPRTIHEAIAWHDQLACAVARLILYTDPISLPAADDSDGGLACYERTWRPGVVSSSRWRVCYQMAGKAMGAKA